jgi:hypothetical protein
LVTYRIIGLTRVLQNLIKFQKLTRHYRCTLSNKGGGDNVAGRYPHEGGRDVIVKHVRAQCKEASGSGKEGAALSRWDVGRTSIPQSQDEETAATVTKLVARLAHSAVCFLATQQIQ